MISFVEHEKHAKLERAKVQTFAWHEIGFFGETCSAIQQICGEISAQLPQFSCVYIDADHSALDNEGTINRSHSAFKAEIIDQQGQFSLFSAYRPDGHALTGLADQFDLALINANHFTPKQTILLWNAERLPRILKRKEQLAQCVAVVGVHQADLPEAMRELLPNNAVFIENDANALAAFIAAHVPVAPIVGLVLAGGRSSRMGIDKASINFHGKPQYMYLRDLLSAHSTQVYLSVNNPERFTETDKRLLDRFQDFGPFGALLTAFAHNPNVAWLVVACDLPLVDGDFIAELLMKRDPSKVATAFMNPETGFPDPLCTLWEPKAYSRLLSFLARGHSCPRKVLINSDIACISTSTPEKLRNVNTPQERDAIQLFLKKQAEL
jgi:molybdopterin-guanine dinucleotide biosynthesis protein A